MLPNLFVLAVVQSTMFSSFFLIMQLFGALFFLFFFFFLRFFFFTSFQTYYSPIVVEQVLFLPHVAVLESSKSIQAPANICGIRYLTLPRP